MKIEVIQQKLNETANNKYFAEWDEDIEDNFESFLRKYERFAN